jgi:hypothetical protein
MFGRRAATTLCVRTCLEETMGSRSSGFATTTFWMKCIVRCAPWTVLACAEPDMLEVNDAAGLTQALSAAHPDLSQSAASTVERQLHTADSITSAQAASVLYQRYLALSTAVAVRVDTHSLVDPLAAYAAECLEATGLSVPAFNCDHGTEVPGQGSIAADAQHRLHGLS